jgi:hypothetical protein
MTPRQEAVLEQYPYLGWDALIASARLRTLSMDCGHLEMVKGAEAETLAAFIEAGLADR